CLADLADLEARRAARVVLEDLVDVGARRLVCRDGPGEERRQNGDTSGERQYRRMKPDVDEKGRVGVDDRAVEGIDRKVCDDQSEDGRDQRERQGLGEELADDGGA